VVLSDEKSPQRVIFDFLYKEDTLLGLNTYIC